MRGTSWRSGTLRIIVILLSRPTAMASLSNLPVVSPKPGWTILWRMGPPWNHWFLVNALRSPMRRLILTSNYFPLNVLRPDLFQTQRSTRWWQSGGCGNRLRAKFLPIRPTKQNYLQPKRAWERWGFINLRRKFFCSKLLPNTIFNSPFLVTLRWNITM